MTSQSRRDLLKKTLAVGTAAYVAPMIVGQTTTVHAQAISGNICTQVDTCQTFGCSGGDCACVPTVGGPTVCVSPTCGGVACTTTAQCGFGAVCFTLGCCGQGNFCVPLCDAVSGAARSANRQNPWKRT